MFDAPHPPGQSGSIAPAGAHSEGQRANRNRFNDLSNGIYRWVRKQLPTPGALNYAFETLGLVEFSPINAGIPAKFHFNQLEGGIVQQNSAAVLTNGLGGLVTGNIYLTPLYDPNTNTFGGVPISGNSAVSQEFASNTGI